MGVMITAEISPLWILKTDILSQAGSFCPTTHPGSWKQV